MAAFKGIEPAADLLTTFFGASVTYGFRYFYTAQDQGSTRMPSRKEQQEKIKALVKEAEEYEAAGHAEDLQKKITALKELGDRADDLQKRKAQQARRTRAEFRQVRNARYQADNELLLAERARLQAGHSITLLAERARLQAEHNITLQQRAQQHQEKLQEREDISADILQKELNGLQSNHGIAMRDLVEELESDQAQWIRSALETRERCSLARVHAEEELEQERARSASLQQALDDARTREDNLRTEHEDVLFAIELSLTPEGSPSPEATPSPGGSTPSVPEDASPTTPSPPTPIQDNDINANHEGLITSFLTKVAELEAQNTSTFEQHNAEVDGLKLDWDVKEKGLLDNIVKSQEAYDKECKALKDQLAKELAAKDARLASLSRAVLREAALVAENRALREQLSDSSEVEQPTQAPCPVCGDDSPRCLPPLPVQPSVAGGNVRRPLPPRPVQPSVHLEHGVPAPPTAPPSPSKADCILAIQQRRARMLAAANRQYEQTAPSPPPENSVPGDHVRHFLRPRLLPPSVPLENGRPAPTTSLPPQSPPATGRRLAIRQRRARNAAAKQQQAAASPSPVSSIPAEDELVMVAEDTPANEPTQLQPTIIGEPFDHDRDFFIASGFDIRPLVLGEGTGGKVQLWVNPDPVFNELPDEMAGKMIKFHPDIAPFSTVSASQLVAHRRLIESTAEWVKKEYEFMKELEACKHIMPCYELHSFADGINHVMLMPLADGDLWSWTHHNGSMLAEEAFVVAEQLVGAVAFCHSKSLVHCDIKLANISYTVSAAGKMHIYLADFGLMHGIEEVGTSGGTPMYRAPEVIETGSCLSGSDVYSVFVCLAELIDACGTRSGHHANEEDFIDLIQYLDPRGREELAPGSELPAYMLDMRMADWADMGSQYPEDRPFAATIVDRLSLIRMVTDDARFWPEDRAARNLQLALFVVAGRLPGLGSQHSPLADQIGGMVAALEQPLPVLVQPVEERHGGIETEILDVIEPDGGDGDDEFIESDDDDGDDDVCQSSRGDSPSGGVEMGRGSEQGHMLRPAAMRELMRESEEEQRAPSALQEAVARFAPLQQIEHRQQPVRRGLKPPTPKSSPTKSRQVSTKAKPAAKKPDNRPP